MRPLRTLGLVLVVSAAGLLSGGAAGGAPTTDAVLTVASGLLPDGRLMAGRPMPAAAPAPAVPAVLPVPAPAAVPAVPVPAPAAVPAAPLPAPAAVPAAPLPAAPVPGGAPAAPMVGPMVGPQPAAAPKPKPKPVGPVAGTPCRATASACVDLSANRAWLLSNGKIQYGPVPITHGRKGFRTPAGTFRVSYKQADHVSSIYDAEMPYSVFFNGGIAFHQGSLKQLSHGCIHLSGKAARAFFGALSRGEIVQVVR